MQQLNSVMRKLLLNSERQHNQSFSALMLYRLMSKLKADNRFTESEFAKYRTPSALERPDDRIALVRHKRGIYLFRINVKTRLSCNGNLAFEE